jgi:hypothetical protein
MRVLPVGISASNLSVFWPLWDAALLRRYGRAKACSCPPSALLVALRLALLRKALLRADAARVPGISVADLPAAVPASAEEPPPELDLHWPSDEPLAPPQIIVVERPILREAPRPGELVDLLY